jgi:hypothetical protein
MQLGSEMHKLALKCAEEKLRELRPGGFSIEQRYRYNKTLGVTTLMSKEQVQLLLSQDRARDLLGTLVPDIVIHNGNPLQVQAIYDFKFPCSIKAEPPPWNAGENQGAMYEKALQCKEPKMVAPSWGIIP